MNFLLMILLVAADGATPVHFEPFKSVIECEAKRAAVLKQIPRRVEIEYVAVCAPVKNATQVEV
jgi:hypothetical protein